MSAVGCECGIFPDVLFVLLGDEFVPDPKLMVNRTVDLDKPAESISLKVLPESEETFIILVLIYVLEVELSFSIQESDVSVPSLVGVLSLFLW